MLLVKYAWITRRLGPARDFWVYNRCMYKITCVFNGRETEEETPGSDKKRQKHPAIALDMSNRTPSCMVHRKA